jgi:AmiR/NasT family two-component response regulator
MKHPLRVAVADDESDVRDYLQEVLPRLGYEVVGVASTGRELTDQVRASNPDLIIADIKMPDMDGIEASTAVNRDRAIPVVLVSAHHDAQTLTRVGADHIMGYLVKPISEADLKTAITLAMVRFQHFQALVKETSDLRQALEDRKLVEKAKGVVMKRLRVDEEESFRRMRKHASDHNLKLAEVSRRVIAAEEVFREMEKN